MAEDLENMLSYELDLGTFDESNLKTRSIDEKLKFQLLSEIEDDDDCKRKLYELVKEGVLSSPQSDGQFVDYGFFIEKLYYPCYKDVGDSFMIAFSGKEWIGLTGVIIKGEKAEGGLTVIRSNYRGKGIGSALKTAFLVHLKNAFPELKVITTDVHKTNHSMIALNKGLGFKVV